MPPKKDATPPPVVSKKDECSDEDSNVRKRKRKNDSEAGPSSSKKAESAVEPVVEDAADEQTGEERKKKKKRDKKKSEEQANGHKADDKATDEENNASEEPVVKKKKKKSKQLEQDEEEEEPPVTAAAAAAAAEETDDAKGKSKRKSHTWLPKDETSLAKQMLEDLKANPEVDFDSKLRGDAYWNELHELLKGKLSYEFVPDQIFEKYKRMKNKFKRVEKQGGEVTKSGKKRVSNIHAIFKQLWSNEDVAAKPGVSAFGSKFTAQSDGEESDGEFAGFPHLSSVKKEALANGKAAALGPVADLFPAANGSNAGAELSRVMKSFLLETISQVSSVAGADPVISFGSSLCSGVESMMKSYKLGFEASTGNPDVKKRLLEEQAAEYSAMKRRLKLVLDYCEVEEDVLKKKLQAL